MVLTMLIALSAAPALMGTQEAVHQSQNKEKREEHRARRCNLIATCVKSTVRSREIDGRQVVLKNNKLYIDTGTVDGMPLGHPFAGYYLPYPEAKHEGLVTTTTDVAPILNWIYIDKDTYQVKHGVRVDAQPHHTGPFDVTRQDRRMTFDGWEGFLAVEEEPYLWALYFDVNDDGLEGKLAPGTRALEIELWRKEKPYKKDPDARKQDQATTHDQSEIPADETAGNPDASEEEKPSASPAENGSAIEGSTAVPSTETLLGTDSRRGPTGSRNTSKESLTYSLDSRRRSVGSRNISRESLIGQGDSRRRATQSRNVSKESLVGPADSRRRAIESRNISKESLVTSGGSRRRPTENRNVSKESLVDLSRETSLSTEYRRRPGENRNVSRESLAGLTLEEADPSTDNIRRLSENKNISEGSPAGRSRETGPAAARRQQGQVAQIEKNGASTDTFVNLDSSSLEQKFEDLRL